MIQKLMAILDSAAAITKGPALSHFIPTTENSQECKKTAGIQRYIQYFKKYLTPLKVIRFLADFLQVLHVGWMLPASGLATVEYSYFVFVYFFVSAHSCNIPLYFAPSILFSFLIKSLLPVDEAYIHSMMLPLKFFITETLVIKLCPVFGLQQT